MFTVWYIGTPVACDSRYTLSTVRKLTPRPVAVLTRGLSIIIIIFVLPFEKCYYFTDCLICVFRKHCYLRHEGGYFFYFRMSLEFIEMVPSISNDCTVTSCTHVWLL